MALSYATVTAVKARLQITDSIDDAFIATCCNGANAYIEDYTGRAIGSNTVTRVFDGTYYSLETGHCLLVPEGIRSITSLEVAPYTGAAYVTVPVPDYFLRPVEAERDPGWPATEVWMTNIPSSTNTYPYFPEGFATVRMTYEAGWAAIPANVAEVAEILAVRAFQARQAGQSDQTGEGDIGVSEVGRFVAPRDRQTLNRYRRRPVLIY